MCKNEKTEPKTFKEKLKCYIVACYDKNIFLLEDTEKYIKEKKLFSKITKTQMRNVFDLIKNCTSVEELKMTKPRLMYTAGRLSGSGKYFLLDLSQEVTNIENEKQMEAMKKFIETVLAYHKYHANY